MADPFRKVQPGDRMRISADAYNAFVEAAQAYRDGRQGQGREISHQVRSSGIVRVRNDSGSAVGRFGVLGVDAPAITPTSSLSGFQNHLVLSCSTPASAHAGRFVVLLEPIPAGRIGRAMAGGVVQVQIDVTDSGHGFAEVKNSDPAKLASGATGSAVILWKESGTGTKWAIIRIGGGDKAGTANDPAVILPSSFETESAQSDTWDRANPPSGKDGVKVRLQTRTAYNESGDQKLYAYYREFTYDSLGKLASISAETRVIVDTPGAC